MTETPRLYLPEPVEGDIPPGQMPYVDDFVDLAEAIDACAHSEQVTLLLSTCRNVWMTINAVFVDLKTALGLGELPDPISRALFLLAEGRPGTELDRALDEAGSALRQAREKLEVWAQRGDLQQELEAVMDGTDMRTRSRLRNFVEQQQRPPDSSPVAHGPYLALNLEVMPVEADRLLAVCRRAGSRLRELLGVVRALRPVGEALALGAAHDAEPQETLLSPEAERSAAIRAAWPALQEAVAAAAPQFGPLEELSEGLQKVDPATLQEHQAEEWLQALVRAAGIVVIEEQENLGSEFRPNLATSPLPRPFAVDLSQIDGNPSSRGRPFSLEQATMTGFPQPADTVRIGLLRCGLREEAYSHTRAERYILGDDSVERVTVAAAAAIDRAADEGCALLAMPEVFMPSAATVSLCAHAKEKGIILVAGVDYTATRDGTAVNQAVVALPGLRDHYAQRKQGPSVYEVRSNRFAADQILRVFRHTPVGNFAVVVCSDYLELDILAELAGIPERLDLLIVCSRNPRSEVFEQLALADAVRMYAAVAVVNARPDHHKDGNLIAEASGEGTFVALPTKEGRLTPAGDAVPLEVPWSEGEEPALALYDLPLAGIRGRDRERPLPGFLPASTYVRRPD